MRNIHNQFKNTLKFLFEWKKDIKIKVNKNSFDNLLFDPNKNKL